MLNPVKDLYCVVLGCNDIGGDGGGGTKGCEYFGGQ